MSLYHSLLTLSLRYSAADVRNITKPRAALYSLSIIYACENNAIVRETPASNFSNGRLCLERSFMDAISGISEIKISKSK